MKDAWIKKYLQVPDTFIPGKGGKDGGLADGPRDHLFMSAARSDQIAQAGQHGEASLFTRFLVHEVETHGGSVTFEQLIEHIGRKIIYSSSGTSI